MDDIIKSIKAYLYDRATSPLFGAFAVSWSIWNYRTIAILLSNESNIAKFGEIDKLYLAFEIPLGKSIIINGALFHGFIIPAMAALLFIYLYPIVAKPIYKYSLSRQKELKEIKQENEDNKLLSVKESREIYKQLSQLQEECDKEAEKFTKQISSLTQTVNEQDKELIDKKTQVETLVKSLLTIINGENREQALNVIKALFDSTTERGFRLEDLVGSKHWDNLTESEKNAIKAKVSELARIQDFLKISREGSNESAGPLYLKKSDKVGDITDESLPENKIKILKQFIGHAPNVGLSSVEIANLIHEHIDEVRVILDDMVEDNYLTPLLKNIDTGEFIYSLTPKGRKFLVTNKLHVVKEEQ